MSTQTRTVSTENPTVSTKKTKSVVAPDSIFTPQTPLEKRWWDYNAANPHVLAAFRSVCEELLTGGKKREGAKAVAELVRHHRTYQEKPIKISNSFVSYYARYLAASDDRFASFFFLRASPAAKRTPTTPGFAELLAFAKADESESHLGALSNARGVNSEKYAELYHLAFSEHFPAIVAQFPLPTDEELAEFNAGLSIPYTKYEVWEDSDEMQIALAEYLTALRHAALRACSVPILTSFTDGALSLVSDEIGGDSNGR